MLSLGRLGERKATSYLRSKRYYIWKTNWKTRSGEIDVVALDGSDLVIIEVKTRTEKEYMSFHPFDSIDNHKRRKLRALAEEFISQHSEALRAKRVKSIRFDYVAVFFSLWCKVLPKYRIEHIQDAFNE